jgi:hypothetical protein
VAVLVRPDFFLLQITNQSIYESLISLLSKKWSAKCVSNGLNYFIDAQIKTLLHYHVIEW